MNEDLQNRAVGEPLTIAELRPRLASRQPATLPVDPAQAVRDERDRGCQGDLRSGTSP